MGNITYALKSKRRATFIRKKGLFYFLSRCGLSLSKERHFSYFEVAFQKKKNWKIEMSADLSDKNA